ncbi:MAG: hypothetical protein GY850_01330 [bacterium]|nr:hypothetical protein [bacterium]
MADNSLAIQLIDRYRGKIVLEEFKIACEKFRDHVKTWEDVWKLVLQSKPMASSIGRRLIVPPFPKELNDALRDEIEEVKRRAG